MADPYEEMMDIYTPSSVVVWATLLATSMMLGLAGIAFYIGAWQMGIAQGVPAIIGLFSYRSLVFARETGMLLRRTFFRRIVNVMRTNHDI